MHNLTDNIKGAESLNYIKQLLIPLCHSCILLPVCAILGGAPGTHALIALMSLIMVFSLIGWVVNILLSQRIPQMAVFVILFLIGTACGISFLPGIWCNICSTVQRDWFGPVMGAAAGGIMIWSYMECHHGLQHGMPNYELGIGMVLYIFTYFAYRADGRYINEYGEDLYQPIYIFGAVWTMLAVIVMNYQHINRMAATRHHPKAPRNVLVWNVIFSIVLAGGTLLFANLGLLRRAAAFLFQQLINFLFPYVEQELPEADILPDEEPEMDEPGGVFDWQLPMWVQITLLVIAGIIIIAVVIFMIRLCWELAGDRKKKIKNSAYEEEIESLMDWDEFKQRIGKRFRRARGSDFEDQPDARSRVRWLYTRFRDELRRREKYNSTLTPNEQARVQYPAQEDAYQLTELYNRARYSEQDIHEEEALAGREYLEEILKMKWRDEKRPASPEVKEE